MIFNEAKISNGFYYQVQVPDLLMLDEPLAGLGMLFA